MGVSLQAGLPKFKVFNLLSQADEIFKVREYKGKTKFVNTKMEGPPQTGPPKFKVFNSHARLMKLLG